MSCNEKNFIKRLQKKKEDGLEYVIDHYLAMVKGTVVKAGALRRKRRRRGMCQ